MSEARDPDPDLIPSCELADIGERALADPCDVCGAIALVERKCMVLCRNCGTILRTCADLG